MDKLHRITSLFFIALVMVGCTSIPEQTTSVEWQAHSYQLSQIQSYRASGKLGYISPEQRQSLNFTWTHSKSSSQLRLTTFLGQTALNLTVDKNGAKVVTYDDQVFTHKNATILVKQLTGLQIPVQHLPQWLLALPEQADTYQLNAITNTLDSLTKQVNGDTWTIDFSKYQDIELPKNNLQDDLNSSEQLTTIPLPSRLSFKQDSNKINIVISKWTLTK
ncbi:lipoprotein insertase outer membrane protein LolB [Vibrio gallaecicus]|uniref:lipoprotein insertase outer membrane protein LolB n=1 Tax=Vibrio gallaecicus TaxID=552386 RepID=UPI0010CA09C9|nr:lipoprotein insertase outer membrane protein LolB [Vibrio gallaecicus]MDN3614337.1 lipoprotein insertase outer membrane protein LolB [Vibrio gallaecicus]